MGTDYLGNATGVVGMSTARMAAVLSVFLFVPILAADPSLAQTPAPAPATGPGSPGYSRIQGRDAETPPPPIAPSARLRDFREDMRKFVQKISTFSRRYRRNFIVIPQNGLNLLAKIEEGDETRQSPARTYMRSVDGILVESLFMGGLGYGQATVPEKQTAMLKMTDLAKANGLQVLAVDYVKGAKAVNKVYRDNKAKGYISFAAHAPAPELSSLPPYPRRPFAENPNSILSLKNVRNFLYLRESAGFGRPDEFAMKLHATNYDMVITDVFHGRGALSKQAVETLKYKKLGSRRLVLAYVNIGTAASYHYYWKQGWREGAPRFLNAPYPGDPDKHFVAFWDPEWQSIIFGDTKSFIYGIIAQGFDGVILDGLDAYRFFEGGGEEEQGTP